MSGWRVGAQRVCEHFEDLLRTLPKEDPDQVECWARPAGNQELQSLSLSITTPNFVSLLVCVRRKRSHATFILALPLLPLPRYVEFAQRLASHPSWAEAPHVADLQWRAM
eukprot:6481937-Amphidinium_carterae.1